MADPAPILPKAGAGTGKISVSDLNDNKNIKRLTATDHENSSIEELKEFFIKYGVAPSTSHEAEDDGEAGKQTVKMSNFKENTFLGMQLYSRNETSATYKDNEDVAIAVTQWPPADKGGYACSFEFTLTDKATGISRAITHNKDGLIVDIPLETASGATKHEFKSSAVAGADGAEIHIKAKTGGGNSVLLTGSGGTKAKFSGQVSVGSGGVVATGTGTFGGTTGSVDVRGTEYYTSKVITADGAATIDSLALDAGAEVIGGDGSEVPDAGKTLTLAGGVLPTYSNRNIYLAPGATGEFLNGTTIVGDGLTTIVTQILQYNSDNGIDTEELGVDSKDPATQKSTISSADSRASGTVAPNAPLDTDVLAAGETITFTGGAGGLDVDKLVENWNGSPALEVLEGGSLQPSQGAKIFITGGRSSGSRIPNTGSHSGHANFGRGHPVWDGHVIGGGNGTSRNHYDLSLTAILPDSTEANPATSSFSIQVSPGYSSVNRWIINGPDVDINTSQLKVRHLKFPYRNSAGTVVTPPAGRDLTMSQGLNFCWSYNFVIMAGTEHPAGDAYGTMKEDSIHS